MYDIDLFSECDDSQSLQELLQTEVVLLRGLACSFEMDFLSILQEIIGQAPFRHMMTPGGFKMSVAMTNCGSLGWISDQNGYRYVARDPMSGSLWPCMPNVFRELATSAAEQAGFKGFHPDACLINRYEPKTKLSLHQDKDERDLNAPVVSVSLGLPATFLYGGTNRTNKPKRILLSHGDVLVWGGSSRLMYHGILPLKAGSHPLLGSFRFNLTLRKAG